MRRDRRGDRLPGGTKRPGEILVRTVQGRGFRARPGNPFRADRPGVSDDRLVSSVFE